MPSDSVKNPMGSIRFENKDAEYISAGLRFRGTLTSEQYADATEIGFIAAPYKAIANDSDWYQLDANGIPSAEIAKRQFLMMRQRELILSILSTVPISPISLFLPVFRPKTVQRIASLKLPQ